MDFSQVIESTLNSFDFSFCISVNILTYIIIVLLEDTKLKVNGRWKKRIVLLFAIVVVATFYNINGTDLKLILNSSILAPVSWTWIFKPICKRFNIDYKDIDDVI